MNNRTKYLQFGKRTVEEIYERDNYTCLFCKVGYFKCFNGKVNLSDLGFNIYDPMHFIGKGKGGLGVVQNGICGCRNHHHVFDNGNVTSAIKQEMQQIAEEYIITQYPDLDISKLVYQKYGDWFYLEKGEVKLKGGTNDFRNTL